MPENTYRTILFEEFNPDAKSLDGILSLAENPAADSVYDEVLKKLAVKSFAEFLEKFAPTIYESYEPGLEAGTFIVSYSTTPTPGARDLHITDSTYYKMLKELYEKKGASGNANLDFAYEELFEQLKPEREVADAKRLRKQLNDAWEKYYECKDKGEITGAEEARNSFNAGFKKVRQQYQGSTLNLLPLALDDLNAKISALDGKLKLAAEKSDDENLQIAAGYTPIFLPDGTLTTKPVETAGQAVEGLPASKQLTGGGKRKLLSAIIESDYDKHNKKAEEGSADFVRALIVSTYSPLAQVSEAQEISLAELRDLQAENKLRRDRYEKTFRDAKESFIQALTEVVQQILSVYVLFDHATLNGTLNDGIIIANCTVGNLMQNCREKFEKFIKRVGNDSIGRRIWFGIVPGVSDSVGGDFEETDDDDDDFLDDEPKKTVDAPKIAVNTVTQNQLKQILPIMDAAKILTVFSFKANEKNGFAIQGNPQYVNEIRELLEKISNKHAVCAYPNFTLTTPKGFTLFENGERLTIPGVYIEAAYVAGGLLIAASQPKYLEKCGLKVHSLLPCVRIDFENPNIQQKLLTKFNRESIFGREDDLRRVINEDQLGFVFSGAELKNIQNTYVYLANTLYKPRGSKNYRPIYVTLMEDYVFALYSREVSDKSRRGIQREFLDGVIKRWIVVAQSREYKNAVNLLLHENEKIVLEDNEDTGKPELKIKFSAREASLEGVIEVSGEQN